MRTAGEILSGKRNQLGLSLEQIEKDTKIRKKYLEAIEKNNYSFFSESTTVKGFIRNFALAVGISPENILAIFRRDFVENEKGQIIPRGFTKEIEERSFHWTPKITFFLFIGLLLFSFCYFFASQYWRFSSPPRLEVYSPKEEQVFKEKVEILGKTDKDATIMIDGSLIVVSKDGSFKEEIVLPRGENIITIEAANRQGKKRTLNIKVKVE